MLTNMATENIQHDFVFENNAKVFKCSMESCKHRKFATAWTLNRHMNMVHAKEFHCPIDDCFQVFDTRLALSKHKKKHKKNFACDRCNSTFTAEKYLETHKSKYHGNTQISRNFCLHCEKQYDNYGELQNHINEEHNKKTKFERINTAYNLKHQDWRMNLGKFFYNACRQ